MIVCKLDDLALRSIYEHNILQYKNLDMITDCFVITLRPWTQAIYRLFTTWIETSTSCFELRASAPACVRISFTSNVEQNITHDCHFGAILFDNTSAIISTSKGQHVVDVVPHERSCVVQSSPSSWRHREQSGKLEAFAQNGSIKGASIKGRWQNNT